nr:hypothetical protein [uncultured Flavobacterium sp.]
MNVYKSRPSVSRTVVCKPMTHTPYITIVLDSHFDNTWMYSAVNATFIFSKYIDYKELSRKRINIYLSNEERIHLDRNLKSIWVKSPINPYEEMSDIDRRNAFLKIIYNAVMTIAEIERWDRIPFDHAYSYSISDNGAFIWQSKLKNNKTKTFKARVKFLLDKSFKISIIAEIFNNATDEQFDILIIDTFLHFVDWEVKFRNPIWIDSGKFGYDFLNSQLLLFADLKSRQSKTIILEKDLNRHEVEGELRRLTFRTFRDHQEFVDWANR